MFETKVVVWHDKAVEWCLKGSHYDLEHQLHVDKDHHYGLETRPLHCLSTFSFLNGRVVPSMKGMEV